MKKFFFLLLLYSSSTAFAQKRMPGEIEPKGEIAVGFGILTVQEIALTLGNAFSVGISEAITGGDGEPNIDVRSTGTFFGGYNGYLSKRWSAGLQVFYGEFDITNTYSNGKSFRYTNRYIGGLVRTDFRWINGDAFQLYSAAGLGLITVQSQGTDGERDNTAAIGVQVSPIGIRFGDTIGIFAEVGFGNTGVLAIGASYIFK